MHATPYGAAPRSVLEDYPPVDKPTRFPLRQRWRSVGPAPAAPDLATLSNPRRFLVLPGPDGGEIRAACERSLGEGRSALAKAMPPGAALAFDTVRAHRYVEPRSGRDMEPWMFVRIDTPRSEWERLAAELRARGARLHEVEMQAHRAVLRAEAALERLLGFLQHAMDATNGKAQVAAWLVRYEPVGGPRAPAMPGSKE